MSDGARRRAIAAAALDPRRRGRRHRRQVATATGPRPASRSTPAPSSPGDLFVALTAARDGHDFVADALARGAAAALVSRRPEGVPADAPLLVVPDVLDGAARARRRGAGALRAAGVVAVTGSVGKTGTKEMLRVALGRPGPGPRRREELQQPLGRAADPGAPAGGPPTSR